MEIEKLIWHRNRCYDLAEAAPTPELRARLLVLARMYDRKADLVTMSRWRISASWALLAKLNGSAPSTDSREAP